jgi:hypothetical protein
MHCGRGKPGRKLRTRSVEQHENEKFKVASIAAKRRRWYSVFAREAWLAGLGTQTTNKKAFVAGAGASTVFVCWDRWSQTHQHPLEMPFL